MIRNDNISVTARRLVSRLFMAGFLILILTTSSHVPGAYGPPEKKAEISIIDSFSLSLEFPEYPEQTFNLWMPEVAIFDKDLERSHSMSGINGVWHEKMEGSLRVKGRGGIEAKDVTFTFMLKSMSASSIRLVLEVVNTGQEVWSDYAHLAICLAPAEKNTAYSDPTGASSYVSNMNGKLTSLILLDTVGDFNHYPVGSRTDILDVDQRSQIYDGFVARTSTDGKSTISFMWESAARVDVNPGGLDCIHSHPAIGPLNVGESIILTGYIIIENCNAEESYDHMKKIIQ